MGLGGGVVVMPPPRGRGEAMGAFVSRVKSDSSDGEWEITVLRERRGVYYAGGWPEAEDVPRDVLEALAGWALVGLDAAVDLPGGEKP